MLYDPLDLETLKDALVPIGKIIEAFIAEYVVSGWAAQTPV